MEQNKYTAKNKKKPLVDGLEGLGKLPPQAIEFEEVVLGAIMLEKHALSEVIQVLKPESFYKEGHQKIYQAAIELFENSLPIDLLTVTNKLRTKGELEIAGGAIYVSELTSKVSSAANIEYHARIIAEFAIKRELISFGSQLQREGFEDTTDVFELLNGLSNKIYKLESTYFSRDATSIMDLSKEVMKEVARAGEKKDGITGEITGIEAIDNYTGGLGKQDFVVIGARPGMGKSSLVHSMMQVRGVHHGKNTALFSLEMSSLQVTKVLHSHQTGIDHEKLRTGKLEQHEWATYHQEINPLLNSGIYIDDTPSLSITEMRAKARRLVAKNNVTLIILDYIQLATASFDKKGRFGNREQEISEISRGCKALAKELNVPVIALAQLSREAEKRANKLPILADLRESGSIEQDADQVWFLFRPAYYGMNEDEAGNCIPKHLTKLIIAKYREGATGEVDLRFIGRMKKFDSMPDHDDGAEMPSNKDTLFGSNTTNNFDDEENPF